MATVVTSFGRIGWHEYAFNFFETFDRHWPANVRLIAYREGAEVHRRARMRDLLALHDCHEFLTAHVDEPMANGRVRTACWRNKEGAAGYSFRTDAVKFCRKVFAVADAAERMAAIGGGVLAWIDADVITIADVPDGFIEGLLGDAHVAYLGRARTHSECGFLAFKIPEALPLIRRWVDLYRSDRVFHLHETHDSFVFDYVRERSPEVVCKSLTPDGMADEHHVWTVSPLNSYTDHLKGARKARGYSPERLAVEASRRNHMTTNETAK